MPIVLKLDDFYQKHQHTGLHLEDFCPSRITRTVKLVPEKGAKILDVGCANGVLSELFKKKGNFVVGIEINDEMAEEARKRIDKVLTSNIEESWPVQSLHFDVVVMSAIMEHIFDYHHVLNEANRVLKELGRILIVLPNPVNLYDRLRFLVGKQPTWYKDFGHIRLWTKPFLRDVLTMHGFSVNRWLGAERLLTFLERIFPTFCRILICEATKVESIEKHHEPLKE